MTELETRLMDALSALSAQWEADQAQQAGEQGMLSARLDDLAQQVSDFAGQHEQQAAALQEQLQQLETQVGLLTEQYATHRSGLQGAGRLVGAGLNRIRQHIAQREQAREWDGPSR